MKTQKQVSAPMQNKQLKKAQSKTFTIFFFLWSTSLVSANPCLNVHQHSKCNQSIMAKQDCNKRHQSPKNNIRTSIRTNISAMEPPLYEKTVLSLPTTPQAHCGNVLQRRPSFYWEQFYQVSKQDWVLHFFGTDTVPSTLQSCPHPGLLDPVLSTQKCLL